MVSEQFYVPSINIGQCFIRTSADADITQVLNYRQVAKSLIQFTISDHASKKALDKCNALTITLIAKDCKIPSYWPTNTSKDDNETNMKNS